MEMHYFRKAERVVFYSNILWILNEMPYDSKTENLQIKSNTPLLL